MRLEDWAQIVLFTPLAAAALAAVAGAFTGRRRVYDAATITLSFVSAAASLALCGRWLADGRPFVQTSTLFGLVGLYLDALSVYFLLLVNLVAFFAAWYVPSFLERVARDRSRRGIVSFHVLFNVFHGTMVLVPMVDNLVLLWMAVELTTLVSTLLVKYRGDRWSLEAAWKYLTITTTGIIFALLGTVFLAAATAPAGGSPSNVLSWGWLADEARGPFDGEMMRLAFLFALVGYGTKAGFAPMHTWLPDGHGEAPSPVSALLSGVLLKSALFAILRFQILANRALGGPAFTGALLLMSGTLSLALAVPFILKRNRFKRLLAYHSLEHMGIIAFGLGLGGALAVFGALLHALNHALTKALMFLVYGESYSLYARHGALPATRTAEDEPLRGLLTVAPLHGGLLVIGGLALVGAPPFNIFYSEFVILWAALTRAADPPRLAATLVFLIALTLIFGGLVVHLTRLLLGPAPFTLKRERLWPLAPLFGLVTLVVVFGLTIPAWPFDLSELIWQSTCLVSACP